MEQVRERKALNRITVTLALVLLVCTFLSRTIENSLLPAVTTAQPTAGTLDLSLRGYGTAEPTPDASGKQIVLFLMSEEAKRFTVGDRATLSWVDGTMHAAVAASEIRGITEDPDTGLMRLVIPADDATLKEGQEVEIKLVKTSRYHDILLPAFAVRSGQDGEEYVFVLRTREGLFGTEYYAEKLAIIAGERNELYASVESLFNMADQVVLHTTQPLSSGQKVRVTNN